MDREYGGKPQPTDANNELSGVALQSGLSRCGDYERQVRDYTNQMKWAGAMTDKLEKLEKAIGGTLERCDARTVPGAVAVEGTVFVYFSDDGKNKFRKQFKNITEFTNPPNATSGGVNDRGCKIELPGGQLFHAISYHGDLNGWRKDIEAGAAGLNLTLARIEGDVFVISNGTSISLSECRVEFD